jgi:hypothetical protein
LQAILGYCSLIGLITPYGALLGKPGFWDIIARTHV